jgi:hypothetical protein
MGSQHYHEQVDSEPLVAVAMDKRSYLARNTVSCLAYSSPYPEAQIESHLATVPGQSDNHCSATGVYAML